MLTAKFINSLNGGWTVLFLYFFKGYNYFLLTLSLSVIVWYAGVRPRGFVLFCFFFASMATPNCF